MRCCLTFSSALKRLRARSAARRRRPEERTLTISVAPSFASKWLVPRLSIFPSDIADIDLRISATVGLADFKRDKVDLAIRLGRRELSRSASRAVVRRKSDALLFARAV